MPRVSIILNEHENEALNKFAKDNLRDPRSQALLIIRKDLIRRGLLSVENTITNLLNEVKNEK